MKEPAGFDSSLHRDVGQLRVALEQLRQRHAEQVESLDCERGRREMLEKHALEKHEELKVEFDSLRFNCTVQMDGQRKKYEELQAVVTGKHKVRLSELHGELDEMRHLFDEFREEVLNMVSKLNQTCEARNDDVLALRKKLHSQEELLNADAGNFVCANKMNDLSEQIDAEARARLKDVKKLGESLSEFRVEHAEVQKIVATIEQQGRQTNALAELDTAGVSGIFEQRCSEVQREQTNLRKFVEESEKAMQNAMHECIVLVERQVEELRPQMETVCKSLTELNDTRFVDIRGEQARLRASLEEMRGELRASRGGDHERVWSSLDDSVATLLPSPQRRTALLSPSCGAGHPTASVEASTASPAPDTVGASLRSFASQSPLSRVTSTGPALPAHFVEGPDVQLRAPPAQAAHLIQDRNNDAAPAPSAIVVASAESDTGSPATTEVAWSASSTGALFTIGPADGHQTPTQRAIENMQRAAQKLALKFEDGPRRAASYPAKGSMRSAGPSAIASGATPGSTANGSGLLRAASWSGIPRPVAAAVIPADRRRLSGSAVAAAPDAARWVPYVVPPSGPEPGTGAKFVRPRARSHFEGFAATCV